MSKNLTGTLTNIVFPIKKKKDLIIKVEISGERIYEVNVYCLAPNILEERKQRLEVGQIVEVSCYNNQKDYYYHINIINSKK